MQTEKPILNAIESADRATGHLIVPLRLLHPSGKSRSRLLHLPDLRHACEPLNPCLHNTAHRSPGTKGPFTSTHCCIINHNEARDTPRFRAWTGVQSELCLAVARIFPSPAGMCVSALVRLSSQPWAYDHVHARLLSDAVPSANTAIIVQLPSPVP
jgi:hypothetical protein